MGTGPLGLGILPIRKPPRRMGGVRLTDSQRVFLQQVAMDLAAKGNKDPTQSQIRKAMRARLDRNMNIGNYILSRTPSGEEVRTEMAKKVYRALRRS